RVHLDRRLTRALAGTCIRARTLAAHRQAATMADAAIAAEVEQPLDVHLQLTAQVAFHRELGDGRTEGRHFAFGEVFDLGVTLHASRVANLQRARAPHSEDVSET